VCCIAQIGNAELGNVELENLALFFEVASRTDLPVLARMPIRRLSWCAAIGFGALLKQQKLTTSWTKTNRPCGARTLGNLGQQAEQQIIRSIDKEHIMSHSRGPVTFYPLFTAADIGLGREASVEHAIKVFLYIGEAIASRWIQMPKGVLLLQTVPDNPRSGGAYLYDRERQIFYFMAFRDGRDDSLTVAEFEQLVSEYDLVSWTANPAALGGEVAAAMA
jgi:hypothetical protein